MFKRLKQLCLNSKKTITFILCTSFPILIFFNVYYSFYINNLLDLNTFYLFVLVFLILNIFKFTVLIKKTVNLYLFLIFLLFSFVLFNFNSYIGFLIIVELTTITYINILIFNFSNFFNYFKKKTFIFITPIVVFLLNFDYLFIFNFFNNSYNYYFLLNELIWNDFIGIYYYIYFEYNYYLYIIGYLFCYLTVCILILLKVKLVKKIFNYFFTKHCNNVKELSLLWEVDETILLAKFSN